MVIQRSSSAQTGRLIEDLLGDDPVRREAASARLAIVGERAVDRLLAALSDAPSETAATILRTLESIGTPRVVPAALTRLDDASEAVAIAAVGALRQQLRAPDDDVAAKSLEGLTTLALATERGDATRLAALDALSEMGPETLEPMRARLRHDASAAVRRMAGWTEAGRSDAQPEEPEENAATRLEAAARGNLPEAAEAVRGLLVRAGSAVGLSVLHDLVLAVREKERATEDPDVALDWMTTRAAAHQVLAERHSRLAIFDLRETFERASVRLPVGFVAAITDGGDASCLPALAAAWQQVDDRWMRDHLAAAFQAIMAREHLTRRHAVVRRALERAPTAADAFFKPSARDAHK